MTSTLKNSKHTADLHIYIFTPVTLNDTQTHHFNTHTQTHIHSILSDLPIINPFIYTPLYTAQSTRRLPPTNLSPRSLQSPPLVMSSPELMTRTLPAQGPS